jgi:hypothetical protein
MIPVVVVEARLLRPLSFWWLGPWWDGVGRCRR